MRSPSLFVVGWVALGGLADVAAASVDRTAKPSGIYRLKPGTYVRKGVACASAPDAAIRRYDGHGFSSPPARACRTRLLSRNAGRFVVEQSCMATGAASWMMERQTVTVADALTFNLRSIGPGTTYRYCPTYMRPAAPRGRVK